MTIEKLLKALYEAHPYPSARLTASASFPELKNLVSLFLLEALDGQFSGYKILDAGTGTGCRLIELAKKFPDNSYLGLDYCSASVQIAKTIAKNNKLEQLIFKEADLYKPFAEKLFFDYAFVMGVLHHLEKPWVVLDHIRQSLKPVGGVFLYVYGEKGSTKRMMRKKIISSLCPEGDINEKIAMTKCLSWDRDLTYGWSENYQEDVDRMIVDSYMNVYEELYNFERIEELLKRSGFKYYLPFGISVENKGLLIEVDPSSPLLAPHTNVQEIGNDALFLDTYTGLTTKNKIEILEEFYCPNGYTVLAMNEQCLDELKLNERLRNLVMCL